MEVEPNEGGLPVPDSIFLFMEFWVDLLLLSEEALPELSNEEEVGSVFVAFDEPKEEDLDDSVGLGTTFRKPPDAGNLGTEAPLPATLKLGLNVLQFK